MISRILGSFQALFRSRSDPSSSDARIISEIRARHLTYLSKKKLEKLSEICRKIQDFRVHGMYVEAGCALGGSSILIASIKEPTRRLQVYDVFDMIPPPSENDTEDVHHRYKVIKSGQSEGIGGNRYYGYQNDLYNTVKVNLEGFGIDLDRQNVTLIKGLVQETLWVEEPIAFAHIDVDWYDPVKTCLERIFPLLSPGGVMVLDDYHSWGGCKRAVDEYLDDLDAKVSLDDTSGSLSITRIG
jgi:predicted O-methyltransferase YrrM